MSIPKRKETFRRPFCSEVKLRSHSADGKIYAFIPFWQPTQRNIAPQRSRKP